MAFTRFNYDPCRTAKLLQESTGPGRYMLNVPGPGCKPCFFEDPEIRLQKWGANLRYVPGGTPIDIDSDLIGITRKNTNDCIKRGYPKEGTVYSEKVNYCTLKAPFTKQSRVTHPPWMYRDLEQSNRYPLFLAQDYLRPTGAPNLPFYSYLNTRLLEKDNFVPNVTCPLNYNE